MAGLIGADELAALRAAAELSLDTAVTITPVTGHTPTAGGYTETTGAPVATMARFATPSAPILAQFANRISGQQAWLVSIPTSVTLPSVGDTVTTTADGAVYRIHAVLQPQSYSTLNRLLVGKALGG